MDKKFYWLALGLGFACLGIGALLGYALKPQTFGSGTSSFTIGGNLTVNGSTTLTGAVTQTGALTLGSTLSVPAGVTTLSNLTVTGTTNAAAVASTALTASSTTVGTNGGVIDFMRTATSTVDADAIAAWSTTSINIGLTGAKVNDACFVSDPYTASGTVVQTSAAVTVADFCTIKFYSATATASFNPSSGVFSCGCLSNPTN